MMQLFQTRADGSRLAFRAVMPLVAPDAHMIWAHVAYTGEWRGYAAAGGEAVELTRESFDRMIENFERQVNPMPLYAEHDMGPAYGWVHQLRRDGDQLFAHIELTDQAREWIAKGQYRYTSIGWDGQGEDRVTGDPIGPEMMEISLTNLPFLDGQQPLQLSRASDRRRNRRAESMPDKQFANAKEAAQKAIEQLDDKATEEQLLTAIKAQMDLDDAVAGKSSGSGEEPGSGEMSNGEPGTTMQEPGAEPGAEGEDQTAVGAELLSMLMGELPDMEPAAMLAAVRENIGAIAESIRSGAEGQGTPADQGASQQPGDVGMSRADRAELKALRRKNEEHERQLKELSAAKEREQTERVEARIAQLELPEAERDDARFLFKHHPERAERIYGGGRFSVPTGEFAPDRRDPKVIADPDKATFRDLSDSDQRVAKNLQRFDKKLSADEAARTVVRMNAKRAARAGAN